MNTKNFKLFNFLKPDEKYISSEEMLKRGGDKMLGKEEYEYLLAFPDKIPTEWQKFYIIFGKDLKRDSVGDLHVPYLRFEGGQWVLGFDWLGYNWDDDDRLACSESLDIRTVGTLPEVV